MRALALALALSVATLAGLAGCYDTPRPDCAFTCGQDGACPAGYVCATDGWCKRADLPDDQVCEGAAPLPDAATPDAAPAP